MPKRRDENAPYWMQLREAEKRIIEYALEHGRTIRGTAAILGISPNYLSERTRELGISTPDVRPGPKPGSRPNRLPPRPELRVVLGEGAMPTSAIVEDPEADEDEDEDELEDALEGDEEEGDEDEGDEDEGDEEENEDDDDDDEDDARTTGN